MQWMLAVCAALVVGAVSTPALAQAKGASGAVEEQIRTRMQELLGNRPDSVTRTPYGVFEVVVGTDVYYTDQATSYVMIGRLIDAKTRQDGKRAPATPASATSEPASGSAEA